VNPRAITGVGVASALGIGREEFLASYRRGDSGVDARVETFDAKAYPDARVAEVRGFDPTKYLGDKGLRSLDRLAKLLVVAGRLALHDAGLKKDGAWASGPTSPGPDHVGLVCSNAYGSLEAITELDRVAVLEDARYINPSRFPLTVSNSAAGYVSIWEDLRAVNVSVSDGNCGALDAVACADVLLDQRRARALLVGGGEAMSEALFLAFHLLGAMNPRSPAAGEGPCIGEGAVLFAVEALGARAVPVLAEIVGYGTSFASPEREGALVHAAPNALEEAIASALADAGVSAKDVDLVVSGVSGLRVFDEAELVAIERALGRDGRPDVPVIAPKHALGETLGAGGAMGMLAALAHLQPREVDAKAPAAPPVPAVATVRGSLRSDASVRVALVTALGYYGNASALVMRAPSR
jgi:3-oxoacyl-(acyl-carrier-protein) synthase